MLTGEQYKETLFDGRAVFFGGKRVDDLPAHPILGPSVDNVADGYDWCVANAVDGVSPLAGVPSNAEELREKVEVVHQSGMLSHVTYTSIMTMATAAGRISETAPQYVEQIHAFIDEAQQRDVRITQCITDAKGDRSRPPGKQDDPDAYVHVVDRQRDGVVIRGAKLHITAASLGHELMTIPTKAMKAGEEDYAIAAMVPVNAPGVKIVNVTYAPRHDELRDFPVSGHHHVPEGFVIFDDVFVPERPHLPQRRGGRGVRVRPLARAVGAPRRPVEHGRRRRRARRPGAAHRRGQRPRRRGPRQGEDLRDDHPRHAWCGRASRRPDRTPRSAPFGAAFPNELYTNAGKYTGAANYNLMVRHLHDIAGGSIVTAPSMADLDNPETGPLVRKYMAHPLRRRRRVPHPPVPRHPRPHRRHLRRLAGGHQHPGRRRPLRPAHRDAAPLRPRRRQAAGAGGGRPGLSAARVAVGQVREHLPIGG